MKALTAYLPTVAKSVTAGAVAFAGSAAVAFVDGRATPAEWWLAAAAGLGALAGVYRIPNVDRSKILPGYMGGV